MRRAYRILLIEGHLPDAVLIERVLAGADDVRLRVVYGAEEARRLLQRCPPYEGLRLPDLVLLDADLPGGIEPIISFLRQDRALRRLPVLLLRAAADLPSSPLTYTLYTTGSLHRPSAVVTAEALLDALRQPWGPWPTPEAAEA